MSNNSRAESEKNIDRAKRSAPIIVGALLRATELMRLEDPMNREGMTLTIGNRPPA